MKKSIVQTNIERRVMEEAEKQTLVDTYGDLIGWMKVLADWLLAPAGAILDGLVLFGIFYLSVKNMPLAIALAVMAAITIQFLYGKPIARAASTVFSGRYDKAGEQGLMWGMWIVSIVGLSVSLYLSFRSDRLVIAVAEQHYQQEDDTAVQDRYDNKLQQLQQQYNTDVAALNERIAALQNDKIMWKGELTTRERSSRKASALSEELATLQHTYNSRVAQIEEQRGQSLQQLQQQNNNTATLFATRVEDGGKTLKGINISFNLIRAVIIVLFMYFVAKAAEEANTSTTATTPVATTVAAPQHHHNNTRQQHFAPAATQEPERTVVKPFSTVLPKMQAPVATPPQQPATPVATTVAAVSTTTPQQSGNTYNVTVVDGEPTLPPPAMMKTDAAAFTLADVRRRIPTYAQRTSDNAKAIHRELLKMEKILEQEKG